MIFQKDREGNELFFPWGILTYGYKVPNEIVRKKIVDVYQFSMIISIVLVVLLFIAIKMFENDITSTLLAIVTLTTVGLYIVNLRMTPLLKNLKKSNIKMRVGHKGSTPIPLSLGMVKVIIGLLMFLNLIVIVYSFIEPDFSSLFMMLSLGFLGVTWLYMKILTYMIEQDKHPENYTVPMDLKSSFDTEPMKWNLKNTIIILALVIGLFGGGFAYYMSEVQNDKERKALYKNMDVNTYAAYLATRNREGGRYDKDAYIFSAESNENQFILNLQLKEITDLEIQERKYISSMRRQACRSKAMGGFLKKGGENHYRFYESKESDVVLFEVILKGRDCVGY